MRRSLLSLIALMLVIMTAAPALAATEPLRDIQGTGYEAAVHRLSLLKVMEGYPEGVFLPDKPVSRAEMAVIVTRMLGVRELPQPAARFADVPASAWFAPYVEAAFAAGITKGYEDGTFQPKNPITYAEVVTMLLRAAHRAQEATGPWPQSVTDLAASLGILQGTRYAPREQATRGEVALLTDGVLRLVTDPTTGSTMLKGLNVPPLTARAFAGLPEAAWYNQEVPVRCAGEGGMGELTWTAEPPVLSRNGADQAATCRVTDEVGQTATATLTGINIDTEIPHLSVAFTPYRPELPPAAVTITAADDLSGVARTEYSLNDGGTWQPYTEPVTLSEPGTYALRARSLDLAGNTATYTVDSPIQLADPNAPITRGGITLLTRKTQAGYLHYTPGIPTAKVEYLVNLMDKVYPVVQGLFGLKTLDDVVLTNMYIWEDSLFTVENLNAFTSAYWNQVNVINGGGALQYGPQRGVYFRLNRIVHGDDLDSVGTLAHEYAHIAQHHISRRRPIPAWLDEGMAENVRLVVVRLSISGSAALQSVSSWKAVVRRAGGNLLTLKEMESWFTIPASQMLLAYDQAALTIRRLIGPDPTMGPLIPVLERIGAGESLEEAWQAQTGTDFTPSIEAAAAAMLEAEFKP